MIARRSMPDVVLVDVALAGLDGREITRRLRADDEMAAISVVHTSTMPVTAQARQITFESGGDAYLESLLRPQALRGGRSRTRARPRTREDLRSSPCPATADVSPWSQSNRST